MNPERGRSSVVSKVKKIRISSVLLACLFLFLVSSPAQETQSGTGDFDINKVREAVSSIGDSSLGNYTAPAKENINYTSVVFRIVFYLALIVLLILGLAWFMRKAGIAGTSKIGGGGAMDVLEVLPFGQNRNAILIRVMDRFTSGTDSKFNCASGEDRGTEGNDLIASSKGSSITQFKDV